MPQSVRHLVVGTAGHVDHGKTALVRALTGKETDRLPEERRRGISIELGFAEMVLPSGRRAAIVDVPGHERFIRHMVAGASGMDLVLLVVAADEGVMPQTREHLDILNLLGVATGMVVLTKTDLVEPDWLDLVEEEVRDALAGSFLSDAAIFRVCSLDGRGVPELIKALDEQLPRLGGKEQDAPLRLPIDRVFSVPGFGTVVSGTLFSGRIEAEDRLMLQPSGHEVRVRQLQVHGESVAAASAGQRVAVNLSGIDRVDVNRGDVLSAEDSIRPSPIAAVRVRLLDTAGRPLENDTRLRLLTGTRELLGRLLLLDRDELKPGDECYGLFRAEAPFASVRGDRFILRSYSPMRTIGGGVVIDLGRRYRRFHPEELESLKKLDTEDVHALLLAMLPNDRPISLDELVVKIGLGRGVVARAVEALMANEQLVAVGDEWLISEQALLKKQSDFMRLFDEYRQRYPLRSGVPREEVRTNLWPEIDVRLSNELLQLLEKRGALVSGSGWVAPPGLDLQLDETFETALQLVLERFLEAGMTPPDPETLLRDITFPGKVHTTPNAKFQPEEILRLLEDRGDLIRIDGDFYLHAHVLTEAMAKVRAYLNENDSMTMAELRDLLGTSRRYAVPFGEYLDRQKFTRRSGDKRRLA